MVWGSYEYVLVLIGYIGSKEIAFWCIKFGDVSGSKTLYQAPKGHWQLIMKYVKGLNDYILCVL